MSSIGGTPAAPVDGRRPFTNGRAALLGLAVVLSFLTVFAIWTSATTQRAAKRAESASRLSDAYQNARFAMGEEESLERKYRLDPGPEVRRRFAQAAQELESNLRLTSRLGSREDEERGTNLLAVHALYLRRTDRLFAAVDRGDLRGVLAADTAADAYFHRIEEEVNTAAAAHRVQALAALDALDRAERRAYVSTPVAFAIGLVLLCGFGIVRRRQRLAVEARLAEENRALTLRAQKSEERLWLGQKLEAVGRLAGGVAHDFNNLLTGISGYTQLLLVDLAHDAEASATLREIERAAARAADLTHQLLAFSRKQVLHPKVLDLNSVVRDVERLLRRLIGEDIDLLVSLDSELGLVKADPAQLEQVVANLVVNGRDAMPNGGRLSIETKRVLLSPEEASAYHDSMPGGEYAVLSVTDTGNGMDAETQANIFEPFFTTKGPGEGTGLGLATVYGIVKQSGGFIWVSSEVGRGTRFDVYLPLTDELAAPVPAHQAAPLHAPGRETVLLVEDEDVVRSVTRQLLERSGYIVHTARSASEALAWLERTDEHVDLLLSDVVMPKISGPELGERLRLTHPEIKVLFMSGYSSDVAHGNHLLSADDQLLQKPFGIDELARRVRELLEGPVVV